MTTLFFICAGFCLYVYVCFPLWVAYRASKAREAATHHSVSKPFERSSEIDKQWPTVSIVIAVRNEAHYLNDKIASLEAVDYPAEKLEVVFVSDGSTDESVSMLQQLTDKPGWSLIHYDEAAGKPTALNRGVSHASSELLVFMDARQRIMPNAIKALAMALEDVSVGAASGCLVLSDDLGDEASNVSRYWQYEKWLGLKLKN